LKLGIDITNLFGEDRRDYLNNDTANFQSFYVRPTTVSFTAKYTF